MDYYSVLHILIHFEIPTVHILRSRKNRPLLWYGGYTYTLRSISKTAKRWMCSSRISKNCKAMIVTDDVEQNILNAFEHHNHEAPNCHISEDGRLYRT